MRPFHHAAIAANGIDFVVKDFKPRLVVTAAEPFLGDGHSNARGNSLPERAGRGFDS